MTDAAWLIAQAMTIAAQMNSGSLGWHEGARRIWCECQLNLPQDDHRLDPFTYWASEFEEAQDVERRSLCERALQVAASRLMETGSAL